MAAPRGHAPRAFICYRVDDSLPTARSLADDLRRWCAHGEFFINLDIRPGDPWPERLRDEVAKANVVFVLIGSQWLTLQGVHGRRRLDEEEDWVRHEIAAALEFGRTIIPVLIDETKPLRRGALGGSVEPLTTLTAVRLRSAEWSLSLQGLMQKLAEHGFEWKTSESRDSSATVQPGSGGDVASAEPWTLPIGARPDDRGTRFRVWAPACASVDVAVLNGASEAPALHPLRRESDEYFSTWIEDVQPGARYWYRVNSQAFRPDPASRSQPEGVDGPSEVVDPGAFEWTDQGWRGIEPSNLVIYELHVGAATPEGTFDALIEHLPDIHALGATAIQLMPVAEFGGTWNWGYDGVDLFAPSHVYGGPDGLRRLVNAAHRRQLAVILDVVFNHLGPQGNYLPDFSRSFFRAEVLNEFGEQPNYDGYGSRGVRDFMVQNARHWIAEYHIDGLRLDAIQAIKDNGEPHVVATIAQGAREAAPNRPIVVVAEDEFNRPWVVRPGTVGPVEDRGYGLDAVYADDFHHQIHVLVSGERRGYYGDYSGTVADLVATINEGWWFVGQYSRFRGCNVGARASDLPPRTLVWCLQNHDQIGNRPFGDRLHESIDTAVYRAISALLCLSPYTPLLFMGQEWLASARFPFFANHAFTGGSTTGRIKKLTKLFEESFDPAAMPPIDDAGTFESAKLDWRERTLPLHAGILALYTDLIRLRHDHPAFQSRERHTFQAVRLDDRALALVRCPSTPGESAVVVVNFDGALTLDLRQAQLPSLAVPVDTVRLDTEDSRYGSGRRAVLLNGRLEMRAPGAVVLTTA